MIKITDDAAQALHDLIAKKGSGEGLRLSVEKGGCAGLQYIMEIDNRSDGQEVIEHAGAKVFVDQASSSFLAGCTLDYEDGLAGAGFRIRNPRAARSCGCGTSFEETAAGKS